MSMPIYDLHSHSTASDGTLSPTDLVCRAKARGVDVLALTDHDTLMGYEEAAQAAKEQRLVLIPGVEVSTSWGNHVIHVVGLGVNPQHAGLLAGLEELHDTRVQRAEQMGAKLEKAGIPNALAEAQKLAGAGNVTRTHFARYLVALGKAKDISDVFKHYLKPNKPGYVKTQWADLAQAIGWITQAGGQAVIAHPDRYNMSATKFRQLLNEFKEAGGAGIEVVYSGASRDTIMNNANFARKFDLKASVGSDFHNPGQEWVELGKLPALPAGLTPIWQDWQHAQPSI